MADKIGYHLACLGPRWQQRRGSDIIPYIAITAHDGEFELRLEPHPQWAVTLSVYEVEKLIDVLHQILRYHDGHPIP